MSARPRVHAISRGNALSVAAARMGGTETRKAGKLPAPVWAAVVATNNCRARIITARACLGDALLPSSLCTLASLSSLIVGASLFAAHVSLHALTFLRTWSCFLQRRPTSTHEPSRASEQELLQRERSDAAVAFSMLFRDTAANHPQCDGNQLQHECRFRRNVVPDGFGLTERSYAYSR